MRDATPPAPDPRRPMLLLTTAPSAEVAARLAEALVERRLAACVNVLPPMRSVYRWRGAVERAEEWQLLIKTRGDAVPALEAAILGLHPYEVPEVLALALDGGARAYLDWIVDSVAPPL